MNGRISRLTVAKIATLTFAAFALYDLTLGRTELWRFDLTYAIICGCCWVLELTREPRD